MGLSDPLAARALDGGQFMTPAATRQIFGDTFSGKYYNGNDYIDVTFRYVSTTSVASSGWSDPDGYMVSGRDVIVYSASASGVNSNANYVTVDVQPEYSLFDFDTLYTAIGVSNGFSQNIAAYQSPFWQWQIGGQAVTFEGGDTVDSEGVFPKITLQDNNIRQYSLCPVKYVSQSLTSGYSLRAGFYGAGTYSRTLYIYIACPYITDGASGATGTFTSTTATTAPTSGDINVNVDMSETNSLLETLISGVDGLLDGLIHLFVPTSDELSAWVDDMDDLLHDHLGGMYQAVDLIDSTYDGYGDVTAMTSFHVDACNIPLAGATLTLGNWDVPLRSAALPQLFYDALAYIIDFLAVVAFLNMLRRKLEIVLNPDSEVVETDSR